MSSEPKDLNAREFLLGGLALFGAYALFSNNVARVENKVAQINFNPFSFLYTAGARLYPGGVAATLGAISINVLSNAIYDLIPGKSKDNSSYSEEDLQNAAVQSGINHGTAVNLADEIGRDAAIRLMKSKDVIWFQKAFGTAPMNGFRVNISNKTDKSVGGQFKFAVYDVKTGQQEGRPFWKNPFWVASGENRVDSYFIETDFSTPGLKRIDVLDSPLGINAETSSAMVMPISFKI